MANRFILNETSYFGAGARESVATEILARGFKKAFVVTDKDLIKFGVAEKVFEVLKKADIAFEVFDDVKANPTVSNVKAGVKAYKEANAEVIVAIGGGSAIDTAKAIGIIIANPDFSDVVSLEGVADTKNKSVPVIAVATTAGTAAEVTINYVITDEETKHKMVCVDPHDIPVVAVVDSELMSSMPKGLTAATGMDALTHAIEGFITKGAWEMSEAVENTPVGREQMALGQYIAGMGFSNVGLGIVHSMAHPLGAWYDTPHGVANAVLLPYVMEYNADATGEKYRDIAKAMGVANTENMTEAEYRKAAVDAVKALSKKVGIPEKLHEVGVKEEDLEALARDAFNDVCTGGNPKDTSIEEILEIYKTAF